MNNMNFDENTISKLKDMMNNGNLNDVISQIPPEMIQNFSSMINTSNNTKDTKDSSSNNVNNNNFSANQKSNNSFDFSKIDMDTLMKVQAIMNKMNNSNKHDYKYK